MKVILTSIFILFGISVFAQNLQLTGKAADEKNTPVSYADVTLSVGDSIIKSELTKEDGTFELSAPQGNYTLTLKQLGEILYTQNIDLSQDTDLGTLKIQQAKELQMVTVTGQKKLIERKVDRLIFNVENSVAATGGDALDALKVTPGLRVQNDQISMIGKSGMFVMVDDRMVQLSGDDLINYLKSIPSDNIKSIEVITAPPAKYDAEGNSGIVNIQLKSIKKNNLNITTGQTYTQATYPAFTSNNSLTYQKNRFSLSLTFNYSYRKNAPKRSYTSFFPASDTLVQSDFFRKNITKTNLIRLNTEYNLKETDKIGLSFLNTGYKYDENALNKIYYYNFDYDLLTQKQANVFTNSKNSNNDIGLYYDHQRKNDTIGISYKIIADYFHYSDNFKNGYYLNDDMTYNYGNKTVDYYNGSADFELPIRKFLLEFGGKSGYSKTSNNAVQNDQNDLFLFKETNLALYLSGSYNFTKKLELKAGLRMESTNQRGESKTLDEGHNSSYTKIFPTLYVNYKLNDNHTFNLNINSRIDRPKYDDVNPYTFNINPNEYAVGNPYLKPSYTYNFEITHNYKSKQNLSFYVSYCNEGSRQYIYYEGQTEIFKPENYFNELDWGITENYVLTIGNTLNSNISLDVYSTKITSAEKDINLNLEKISATFSLNNSITLGSKKRFSLETNFMYQSPFLNGHINIKDYYRVDLGAVYKLFDKKLLLRLTTNDIFNSSYYRFYGVSDNILIKGSEHLDMRNIQLSLIWTLFNQKLKANANPLNNKEELDRVN